MSIDKYSVLVRKNTIIGGGLVTNETINTDNQTLIPFDNMALQVGTSDPERVVIPSLEEVIRINSEIAESNFDIQYTLEYLAKDSSFAKTLPTADELNTLYDSTGIDVKTFAQEDRVLKRTPDSNIPEEVSLKNGEGISVVETGTGLFEVAGYQGDKILISELKNELPDQIAGLEAKIIVNENSITALDGRVFKNEGDISAIQDVNSLQDTEISTIKTSNTDNSAALKINTKNITNNANEIATNKIDISNNATDIDSNTKLLAANEFKYQTIAVHPDTNFQYIGDTVQNRIKETGDRLVNLESNSSVGDITRNTEDIKTLKAEKQPITAAVQGDFNATTMEGRDEEVKKLADAALAAASEAQQKVAAFETSGDLATYILDASAEQSLPVGNDEVITFSGIQTNFGNDDGASGQKVESDLAKGQLIINNDVYPDKRWIIASHMVMRKVNNAGNPSATITLKVVTPDDLTNVIESKDFVVNGLNNNSDTHSISISNIIIDGTAADYKGKKIIVYLDANVTGDGIVANQGRTFGVEEKPGGIVSVVATTDALFSVSGTDEGGTTQEEINKNNHQVSIDTAKVKIDNNGETSVDGINITKLNDKFSGYVKETSDGTATIDTFNIKQNFRKLLDVKVATPDDGITLTLGEVVSNGLFQLTSLKTGQSLIDRNKMKLKQLYVEDGETPEEYINRIFDDVEQNEAFVDGFNLDFNINWSQSKVDWRPATDPLGPQEGKQIWNSIRINNDLTVDFLEKTLIKPVDFDGTTINCTLTNKSNITTYKGKTVLTNVINELVLDVVNSTSNIDELNKLKFDSTLNKFDLAEEGTVEAGSLGAGSIVLSEAEYDDVFNI